MIKDIRNKLVHYCDFNSLKFLTNYMFDENSIFAYPIEYLFGLLLFDLILFINFSKDIFSQYLESINNENI